MAALGTIATARQLLIGGTRRLTFAEFGDPDGTPVFFFHGLPATRLFRHPDDALTASLGIRLITVDRPGLGLSDRQPGRAVLDWADDVSALGDVLKLGSFAVLGHAAGGPYAAACAYRLPGRVTKAAIVNGLPPMHGNQSGKREHVNFPWPSLSLKSRWMLKIGLWYAWHIQCRGQQHHRVWATLLKNCAEADCALFTESPELHAMMDANLEELFQAAYNGYADDAHALMRSWGFRLEEIQIPVTFWCGESDANVRPSAARRMAQAVPRNSIHSIPEAGHYMLLSHWEAILSDLCSAVG